MSDRPRRMAVTMLDPSDGYSFRLSERGLYCLWSEADEAITALERKVERLKGALLKIVHEQTRPGVVGEPSLSIARTAIKETGE